MTDIVRPALLRDMRAALSELDRNAPPAQWLLRLVQQGLDRIPLPGNGSTLLRWELLCSVAEYDLSLAKLYEGHTDALATQMELDPAANLPAQATWGMWASETRGERLRMAPSSSSEVRLNGNKAWCSGAAHVSHALMTAWDDDDGGPHLVHVALDPATVSMSHSAWQAVGMADSGSLTLSFHDAIATRVGNEGQYLHRPGFWHGGAGIAACWYGGTLSLARTLKRTLSETPPPQRSPFRLAALGRVDLALQTTAALLREAAHWIDNHPTQEACSMALRVRLAAEHSASMVLDEVGRALGAAPFCRDRAFARMAADLPVFVRQSHGDHDQAALGERTVGEDDRAWRL